MTRTKSLLGILFLGILTIVPMSLFASGQQQSGTGGEKSVTIQYWAQMDQPRVAIYTESMKAFEAKNPGIKVELQQEVGDNTQVEQKLSAQLAAGNAPQVVHIDTQYIKDMADAGRILKLNDFPGAQDLSKAFYSSVMDPLMDKGGIYGYPIRANTIELIVNNSMLKAAGIDPANPAETMAQLRADAIKLTQKDSSGNITVYGFGPSFNKDPHWTVHAFTPYLWSEGGSYYDPKTMTAGWAGKAGIDTLNYFRDLIDVQKVSPAYDIDNGFQSGKMAMWINGEWQIGPTKKNFPNLDFSFHTIPVAQAGETPILPLGGRAVTIPKGATHQAEAWKLIQWVESRDEQLRYTHAQVGLSPRQDILSDSWFNDHPNFKLVAQDMAHVKAKYAPSLLQMDVILYNAIQSTIINGTPADQALKSAAEQYNKLIQ
ncbi:MAG TPA: ABC transporter substrate-binding protein [Spirochaetia bacterium]|nr:ABC transporter substrate-binding protein [Spirochaetia bacterium]